MRARLHNVIFVCMGLGLLIGVLLVAVEDKHADWWVAVVAGL